MCSLFPHNAHPEEDTSQNPVLLHDLYRRDCEAQWRYVVAVTACILPVLLLLRVESMATKISHVFLNFFPNLYDTSCSDCSALV